MNYKFACVLTYLIEKKLRVNVNAIKGLSKRLLACIWQDNNLIVYKYYLVEQMSYLEPHSPP